MAKPVATTGEDAVRRVAAQRKREHQALIARGYWTEGKRVLLTPVKGLTKANLFGEAFRFQMPPSGDLQTTFAVNYTDYDTIGGKQLSRSGATQLQALSLSTLALDYDVSWASHHQGFPSGPPTQTYSDISGGAGQTFAAQGFIEGENVDPPPSPIQVRNMLVMIAEAKTPFQLEVSQPGVYEHPDVYMLATLRSVQSTEKAGEPDARYFDLSFVEYVRPALLDRDAKGKSKAPQYHPKLPLNVTVSKKAIRAGDGHRFHYDQTNLADLARAYYGSTAKWRTIVQANKALKSWPQSRPLKELLSTSHSAPVKLRIPKSKHAAGS